ncbi:MAG: hypothetical protein K5657_07935 [Desulfovibrio sp.]|nr:hypothetical protein [Desulfovibrio sp.]
MIFFGSIRNGRFLGVYGPALIAALFLLKNSGCNIRGKVIVREAKASPVRIEGALRPSLPGKCREKAVDFPRSPEQNAPDATACLTHEHTNVLK